MAPQIGGQGRPRGDEPLIGGERALEESLAALSSGQDGLIWRAGNHFVRMGAAAIPHLRTALAHPDYRTRTVAAWALQKLAAEPAALAAFDDLIARLDDIHESVRLMAVAALRQMADRQPTVADRARLALDAYHLRQHTSGE